MAKSPKVDCADTPEESVEGRVSKLETQVKALDAQLRALQKAVVLRRVIVEDDDEWLPGFDRSTMFTPDGLMLIQPEPKRRGGPSCKISTHTFGVRRDGAVFFFERFWPEWEEILAREEPTSESLANRLRERFPGKEGNEIFQRFYAYPGELWQLLFGGKIARVPRTLGYAFAGIPRMTLASSVARCRKEPCMRVINIRAMREHLHRKHVAWLRLLDTKGVCDKTLKCIPPGCPHCKRFAKDSESLQEALDARPFPLPNAQADAKTAFGVKSIIL
jgi:hypothetical protein